VHAAASVPQSIAHTAAKTTPQQASLLLHFNWLHMCVDMQVKVPKEETGMVSDLRYGWKKLRKLGTEVSDNLARLQVPCLPI
jgi:hypothetical protein